MRGALAFTLAAAMSSAPAAAQPADNPLPPVLAHVDVVVTDARGRPVTNLTASDFSVVEDGVAKPVQSATFVRADGRKGDAAVVPILSREDERREAASGDGRLFAIFLDEYHVSKGEETERARDAVTRFIQTELGPRDLAVIIKPLDSIVSFRMTHDKAELLKAVETFEGRRGDFTPKNDFEKNYIEAAPARADSVRSQIVTSALDALVTHVGTLQPGRKTLIVVSDGFARPARRREDALPTVESTARDANRRGVSIYAIDPRALAGDAPAQDAVPEREALRILTSETDGRLAVEAAQVAPALAAASADAAAYYMVTFPPAHGAELRTFHQVELKISRPGVTFHARKGYWAALPEDLLREIDIKRAANPPPPPQPMRHASGLIRPWFGVARGGEAGAGGTAKGLMAVNFVWEPVPTVPGDRTPRARPELVVVRATKENDGSLVFTGQIRAEGEPAAAASEVPSEAGFLAPPGRLLLELQIQDADRNVLDTDVRDVIVGGLAGPVEVGTPAVLRATNAREFRAIENDENAVPVATRDFSRADHLLIRLPVYGDGVDVTATLLNKSGGAMRALPSAPRAGTAIFETDLNLAAFAPGEYAVRIAAKSAAGDASETVAFRVVN